MGWIRKSWVSKPQIKLLKGFFTEEECKLIINDFEDNKEHIILSNNYGDVFTGSYEIDGRHLNNNIKKLINKKIDSNILTCVDGYVGELFGVKYSLDTKSFMSPHYDSCQSTSIISLNNDFEGGGTSFPLSGNVYKPTTGDGHMFIANKVNSYHGGHPLTKGIRYALVIKTYRRNSIKQIIDMVHLYLIGRHIGKYKDKYHKELKEVEI